jgi:DNA-binding PadR family transcriptional regulator
MHRECNPPFGFWMGGRHGWSGWGRHGRGRPGRGGRDFGFFASMFGEPGPRAERGGVKYLVLDAVADAPRHGYEIMQVIEERSKGAYRPSPGVIYPTLQMLEEMGFLSVTEKDGRKTYGITEEGRRELEQNRDTVSASCARSSTRRSPVSSRCSRPIARADGAAFGPTTPPSRIPSA